MARIRFARLRTYVTMMLRMYVPYHMSLIFVKTATQEAKYLGSYFSCGLRIAQ